jgi:hypothetical protein
LTSHLRVDTAVGWTSSLHSCISAFDDVVALHHPSDVSGSTPPSRQHRVSGLMQPPDQRRRVSTSMSSLRRRISPPPMDVGSCCHGRRRRSPGLDTASTSNCPRRCCPRSAARCVRHPRRHVPPPGLPTSSPLSTSKAGSPRDPEGGQAMAALRQQARPLLPNKTKEGVSNHRPQIPARMYPLLSLSLSVTQFT